MTADPAVLLLGFTVDDADIREITRRSPVLPTQTDAFAWNVVSALREGGARVSLLSTAPVPNFPAYPKVFFRSKRFHEHGTAGLLLGFINVLGLKHVTRFVQCLLRGTRFIRSRGVRSVVVHGAHTPFLLYARIVKRTMGIRICVILTDPPAVSIAGENRLVAGMKRIDRRLMKSLCSGFDGVIALTPHLASDYAPGVPSLITPGFASTSLLLGDPDSDEEPESTFRVGYGGGLSDEYGVADLVNAISTSSGDIRLELFGRGSLDDWLAERAAVDPRICVGGVLPRDQLLRHLSSLDVLVNPRQLRHSFTKYSFPSKLLEFMSLGVPTISTRLPSLPNGLAEHLVLAESTVEGIAAAIERVRGMSRERRLELGRSARAYVLSQLSPVAQGPAIVHFVEGHDGT
ncbi:glycosyltransferase involved in cell wall biosynthesis [Agromyces sp. 3263]|uniref:glycosyltransferase n=1 Tax=Agromyces sp. 3263 TaxID=2817750 RepID=UPI002866CE06|nr:glycosyltransferase [Agromyces sp. 3263]MDR6904806.1 glycosyltransferase involved in cell wall biosynthesis [Agromyces sp. 3263]